MSASRLSPIGSLFAFALLTASVAGCNNGPSCSPACPATVSACCENAAGDGACVNIITDRFNCGGCGIECAGACNMGVCDGTPMVDAGPRDAPLGDTPRVDAPSGPCTGGTRMCGAVTVSCSGFTGGVNADGRGDPSFQHCGVCGVACDADRASRCATLGGGTGTPECLCGAFRCNSSEVCVSQDGAFVCVNTDTDPDNCGEIGNACEDGERCTGGMCGCGTTGMACEAGTSCCGSTCIPSDDDPANCGGCGITCGSGETCTGGACTCGGDVCAAPAGTSLGEICCAGACVAQDNSNCGACGTVCEDETVCAEGSNPLTMTPQICCTMALPFPIPGFEAICFDFGGGGGFDAGIPFP